MKSLGKVFLSHKSENKPFVEYVAKTIGFDNCVYDKYSFDAGMETLEEIFRGLGESDLFVIFLTRNALVSKWVQKELKTAHELLNQAQLNAIFPIIIEPTLQYSDPLIPVWMQERYNIRQILGPKIAAEKIKSKMIDIIWSLNPFLESERDSFFGRNSEIDAFERRRANLRMKPLKCVIASGFDSIGRKSYIEHSLKKINIMRNSSQYSLIGLERHESIEDFIIKINDLGNSESLDKLVLSSLNPKEKINLASKLVINAQQLNQFIFINDNGVIVLPNREIVDWFSDLLTIIDEKIVFGIAAKYKAKSYSGQSLSFVFSIPIGELDPLERTAMFMQNCEKRKMCISKNEIQSVADILSGYPQQVELAVQMIEDTNIDEMLNNLYEIRKFAHNKAAAILYYFESNKVAMDLLAFLSLFDFLDHNTLNSIFSENEKLIDIFREFIGLSICSYIGSTGEYIRVCDIVRDYVGRQRLELTPFYDQLFKSVSSLIINDDFIESANLSSYYSVIKSSLMAGIDVDARFVLPSHYVQSIVALYNKQQYKMVIQLSKQLIERGTIDTFDSELQHSLYIFLCQALAREHNEDFFSYYKNSLIKNYDQKFLLGFFYRVNSNPQKAIIYLKEAISLGGKSPQINRELVNAYLNADDFENALVYSEENYNHDNTNPYHIQSYFNCLINTSLTQETIDTLKELINDMSIIKIPISLQMKTEMEARFLAIVEGDADNALTIISREISNNTNDNDIHLLLTKFDIAERILNIPAMQETLCQIEKEVSNKSYYLNAYNARRARLLYNQGAPKREIQKSVSAIKFYPETSLIKLKIKVGLDIK